MALRGLFGVAFGLVPDPSGLERLDLLQDGLEPLDPEPAVSVSMRMMQPAAVKTRCSSWLFNTQSMLVLVAPRAANAFW